MKFKLEITLGNDAIQTASQVARALRDVATRLERIGNTSDLDGENGKVSDENGNRVGGWRFSE